VPFEKTSHTGRIGQVFAGEPVSVPYGFEAVLEFRRPWWMGLITGQSG
jgi:hypothetical protein